MTLGVPLWEGSPDQPSSSYKGSKVGGKTPAVLTPWSLWQQDPLHVKAGSLPGAQGSGSGALPSWSGVSGSLSAGVGRPPFTSPGRKDRRCRRYQRKGEPGVWQGDRCSGHGGDTGCPGGMADGQWARRARAGPPRTCRALGFWPPGPQRATQRARGGLRDLSPQRHGTPAGVATRADGL